MPYRRGVTGILILLTLCVGAVVIYVGYSRYQERYYIALYDTGMVRYLDVPPFTERKSLANDALRGHCILRIGTTQEQVNSFLADLCSRKGFIYKGETDSIVIEVRPGYLINGRYSESSTLEFTWKPWLDASAQKKYQAIFGTPWIPPEPQK